MEMTGLQIFKHLPGAQKAQNSNCKECGCPTCMAFALKLAKQNIELEKCPYVDEDLKKAYLQSIKHPQKTVCIGDLKIGGENVLYRHEKTFVNPTVLAVLVDCSKPDYKEKLKLITDFEIKGVNEVYKVDLVILKNCTQKPDCGMIKAITFEEFNGLEITKIVDEDFTKTKEILITTRTKAVKDKDDRFSAPVCVVMPEGDIFKTCAYAGYYICKYANMIVFEEFDEALFSTLITLRQNIFTNPQKPLQVEEGLYEFNNPDENSIIFLTTNFALTFFAVTNELESLEVPSYLIVIPADGMSVLTAWSAEKFTAKIVSETLKKHGIREKIKTRSIIIPGLLEHTIDELKQTVPDFEFVVGTREASEIENFVKNYFQG